MVGSYGVALSVLAFGFAILGYGIWRAKFGKKPSIQWAGFGLWVFGSLIFVYGLYLLDLIT